jgi:adenylosuccinate synthase
MQQSQKTLEFLQKLKDSGHWNDDYDYSEVEYKSMKSHVIVIDKNYNTKHSITPSALSYKNTKCIISNSIDVNHYVLQRFYKAHGDTYNYSNFKYNNTKTLSTIICKVHGEFKQAYEMHIKHGCKKCGIKSVASQKLNNTQILIDRMYNVRKKAVELGNTDAAGWVAKHCN